jgi:hypothetical protein
MGYQKPKEAVLYHKPSGHTSQNLRSSVIL